MSHNFNEPVYFYLVRDAKFGNLEADFKKITDYLLTFEGEVGLNREKDGSVIISYSETDLKAKLFTNYSANTSDIVVSQQITLTCEKEDNLSVNLIKNVTKNIGYRIFNPQTTSYLVINPNLLDLTTAQVNPKILDAIKRHKLTPLFQFQNALVFYAIDKNKKIHLINRHMLEYLIENSLNKIVYKEFSVVVAEDIGRFVALFDRGLIPISFYEYINRPDKILNQSGFNLDKLNLETIFDLIYFQLDLQKQSFIQMGTQSLNHRYKFKKGDSAISNITSLLLKNKKKFLSLKFALDIGFIAKNSKLIPKINVSVYLER